VKAIRASVGAFIVLISVACGSNTPAHAIVKSVSGGWNYTLALKSDGSVWSWGGNDDGELGNGTSAESLAPHGVKTLSSGVVAIAAGWDAGVALKSDGSVWTWGKNDRGQLGDGTNVSSSTPTRVAALKGRVTAIAAGLDFVLVLMSDGTVWGWGFNYAGQLGNGDYTDSPTPVAVQGLTAKVVAIAAGKAHSLAIEADGSVWAWGDNGSNQLGRHTAEAYQSMPLRVDGLGGRAVAVAGGLEHSAVILTDGTVWTWGRAFIPSGDYMGSDTPMQMPGLAGVKQVVGGWDFFVALEANGSVRSWGENLDTLGDGTGNDSLTNPVAVLGLDKGVTAIGTAVSDGYAVASSGAVWAWGNNNHGELGNGVKDPSGGSDSPVRVGGF
jgi:alpha-tubulin suppressor-like RCC1 family protein